MPVPRPASLPLGTLPRVVDIVFVTEVHMTMDLETGEALEIHVNDEHLVAGLASEVQCKQYRRPSDWIRSANVDYEDYLGTGEPTEEEWDDLSTRGEALAHAALASGNAPAWQMGWS